MTADDLRCLLKKECMSQRELARLLEIDSRLVRHWCAGSRPITKVYEYAIRYVMTL